jgi:predicted metal-dependent phosphoesterase TrpH/glycosyltransferase involved in cell wall biosynthesis
VALRICLVTPFSWSKPHDVNEHVAGLADALRERGHSVSVLAPSNRAADLAAGRRALRDGAEAPLIALGPAVPISRSSRIGLPVGVRANLSAALARGRFDVVHGFEPGLPSLSYLALRDAQGPTVASFFSPERLGYPPGKAQREKLLARIDALVASSPEAAHAAAQRYPGEYRIIEEGVDVDLFRPGEKRQLVVLEWRPGGRPLTRAVVRALRKLPDWELVFLRTKALTVSPSIPAKLRGRAHVRTARDGRSRAPILNEAAIFVPALDGLPRVELEAAAAGAAIASPPGMQEQPELAAAALARIAENEPLRGKLSAEARRSVEGKSFADVASDLEELYMSVRRRRRGTSQQAANKSDEPLADRDWILADLHLHTSWSHDCAVEVEEVLGRAERQGLGAIAVTDHNAIGGALEAVELARHGNLIVIAGEEVKTDGQGEVIGLFLSQEIPKGLSFAETVAAIKGQGGIVYLPHPFDRMHAIPDPATIHKHLADIDVFEVYNARLLFEGYNDEALRFARKYNLIMGAGSDAHVPQGLGTGGLRMRAFDGPKEFLLSLRTAEILRRPKSLAYLQSLKWVAQVKERVR